jgi:hypothetical protein
MNGSIKRWLILALGAALAAALAGCVAPPDESEFDDELEDVSASEQPLGVVEGTESGNDSVAPQQVGGNLPIAAGDVGVGEDCMEPEPLPWEPPGGVQDEDDDDGDGDHHTLSNTMLSAPTGGGHHGH